MLKIRKTMTPLLMVLILSCVLIGYQNCSGGKFGINSRNVSFSCSHRDVENFLEASWVPLTVTLGELSAYGNDGHLYPPLNSNQLFWLENDGTATPFCNGNSQSQCTGSSYDMWSYFGDYAQKVHSSAPVTLQPGYTGAVFFRRTPVVKNDNQNRRTLVTLVNRWCKAQKDSSGNALYSAGLTDFDTNAYLPSTYSPNHTLAVHCAAVAPPVPDTCVTSYANNPPVATEDFNYTDEYLAVCSGILSDSSLTPIQKDQACGTTLCQNRGYQSGYTVEYSAAVNRAAAICFHNADFYNEGF